MFEAVIALLRKRTTITNRAVLAVYGCATFYRMAYTLFVFSIIRFLKEGLGENYLLIGALWAAGNVLMILIDLPLGSLQRYFKPRYFLLMATGSLFCSALVFLLAAELTLWLAAVAMFLFQLSIEIYYVVISTSILRLSDERTYAQNLSQQSIFDNAGKILGLAAGGVLFFVDRAIGANSFLVAFSIALLAVAVTLYIYFAIDAGQFNRLERTILELKPIKVAQETLHGISEGIVTAPADPLAAPRIPELPKFSFQAFVTDVRDSVAKLVSVARNVRLAPVLAWGMAMLVLSNWWYNSISTFEPVFIKEIFRRDTGWIADNVPRYFFESAMLILAVIIPTLFALPMGKLADRWGKWKMAVSTTLISGAALLSLAFWQSAGQVFLLYLIMAFGFVAITPALTGLLGQEFKELNARLRGDGGNSEGESAGVMSIAINIGEIGGGLFGGFMLQMFGFSGTFLFFGPLLLAAALGSILLFATVFPRLRSATPAVSAPSP